MSTDSPTVRRTLPPFGAELQERLAAAFDFVGVRPSSDWAALDCPQEKIIGLIELLRDDWGFDMLVDLTAIDEGVEAAPRFTVVYHLYSTERHEYLRLASAVEDPAEEPEFPTVTHLYPAADWHERECYDFFGIRFRGHPDLRRILMWDGYPYFPLRKDFPLAGREVDLPAEDVAQATGARVEPAPMMGGPFRAIPGKHMSDAEPRALDESWTEQRERPETGEGEYRGLPEPPREP